MEKARVGPGLSKWVSN